LENNRRASETEKKALNLEYSFNWGVDFENRVIRLIDDIHMGMFDFVDSAMTELESQSRKAVTVRISSFGGGVYDALAIIGRLRKSPCKIITEGYGPIMSAATAILASGDERRLSRFSWFMHHEASYGIDGKHSEVKNYVMQQEKEEQKWAEMMEEFTGIPSEFWLKEGVGTDAYFDAEKCLELKIVDKLL
jgi:ATP-dependent protease ClpP protease subunit